MATTNTPLYFDYAAATPIDPSVLDAMLPYFSDRFYNPSATYLPARAVQTELAAARAAVAQLIGSRSSEIVFTAGGTEANNLAIQGVLRQFPDANVVVSAIEHESVICPAERYGCRVVAVSSQGIVDLKQLQSMIDERTVLVSIMYANNEIGTVQPLRTIAQALRTVRRERQASGNPLPLYFHTDAAQAAAYLDLHVSRLGVDMMTLNGGKIYGPKQSGALFVHSTVQLQPLLLGGGQERGIRSGTENVAGAVGFSTALALVQQRRHEEVSRLHQLQRLFLRLLKERLPQAHVNGSLYERLPNNVHITIPGQDNERLLLELEQQGVLCAAGSACSASDEEPSHVLRALGLSDDQARASLRFTMGHQTEETAVRTAVDVLAALQAETR
jgi:cysteine desulfurase